MGKVLDCNVKLLLQPRKDDKIANTYVRLIVTGKVTLLPSVIMAALQLILKFNVQIEDDVFDEIYVVNINGIK